MVTIVSISMGFSRIVSIFVDRGHVVVMGNSIEISSVVVHMGINESFRDVSGRVVRIGVLREGMRVFNVGGQVGVRGQFIGRLVHVVQRVFVVERVRVRHRLGLNAVHCGGLRMVVQTNSMDQVLLNSGRNVVRRGIVSINSVVSIHNSLVSFVCQ